MANLRFVLSEIPRSNFRSYENYCQLLVIFLLSSLDVKFILFHVVLKLKENQFINSLLTLYLSKNRPYFKIISLFVMMDF